MERKRLKAGMSGVAGEYFAAGEMSARGYVASITLRNTEGIDILASDQSGSKTVAIQVKTNQGANKSWVLSEKAEKQSEKSLFYVFINLNNGEDKPSFHVVPSNIVANQTTKTHKEYLAGVKRDGTKRKDSSMRKFSDLKSEYENRWDLLGLETGNEPHTQTIKSK